MIDPADPRQLEGILRRHRIDPKHRLGQNFLVDPGVRDAIADAAGLQPQDDVLEVGAGLGTLTLALAPRCRRLIAVELDAQLLAALREVVAAYRNVEVVRADILKYDVAEAIPQGGEIVVGNIPYNLTGALIRKLLDHPPRPRRLSLLVQKEVADRWTAAKGASLSTVAVKVFAQARVVLSVPAAAFMPAPKVESALVALEVRDRPAVTVRDLEEFFRFVESVFQHRRKQLGGALGRITGHGPAEAAARLRDAGIDPVRRPQTLDLAEWEAIFRSFAPGAG